MDLAPLDLAPVLVAAVAAGSALLGAAVGPLITTRAEKSRAATEATRAEWQRRRDVYLELLTQATKIQVAADGAVARGWRRPFTDEEVDAVHRAEVTAELYAPPDTWAEMEPYVRAVSIRANLVNRAPGDPAREQGRQLLADMGALDPDDVKGLRQLFLDAVRADLDPEPPAR